MKSNIKIEINRRIIEMHHGWWYSPKFAVIASMSFGFRLRGRPFCRGACGKPGIPCCCGLKYPDGPNFIAGFSLGLVWPFGDELNCEYWHDMDNEVGVFGGCSIANS